MKKEIDLLKDCLSEIQNLRRIGYDKPEFGLWYEKVEIILRRAFTQKEQRKFLRSFPNYNELTAYQSQKEYLKLLKHYETALKSIIQKYEISEKLSSVKEPIISPPHTSELPDSLFNAMHFHPKIIDASEALFKDGYYAQAIFEAFKAVNNFVKEKANLALDGKALMSEVFSERNPIIKLNELVTQSDKDEQEGFKFLFMGAMVGIRNPKAHDIVVQRDPYRTLEYLGFASLLMNKIDFWRVD